MTQDMLYAATFEIAISGKRSENIQTHSPTTVLPVLLPFPSSNGSIPINTRLDDDVLTHAAGAGEISHRSQQNCSQKFPSLPAERKRGERRKKKEKGAK